MATMEYCAFENTAADMAVAIEKLACLDSPEDLNEYEFRAFQRLIKQCRLFVADAESAGFVEEE